MERPNAWKKYSDGSRRDDLMKFASDYREFLSGHKTERECTAFFAEEAEKKGFKNLDEIIKEKNPLKPGDRVYRVNRKKAIALFTIGEKPISNGLTILGAHIDSPRLDLKQNPLYEDTDIALLDTHYYGGIKKYQWVTLPMALHGVIVKKDGTTINVNLGENEGDPVFGVSDLLIHLAGDQMEKKGSKVVEGEDLDVLFGSEPMSSKDKDEKDLVKKNVLAL